MAKNTWTVLTRGGRKAFEGLENEARKYLSDNFPRLHAEPHGPDPAPDAVLLAPNADPDTGDGIEVFHGPEAGFKPVNEPEAPESDDENKEGNDDGNS